jgi:hypothetical protein
MHRVTVLVVSFALAAATLAGGASASAQSDPLVDRLDQAPQVSPVVPPDTTADAPAVGEQGSTVPLVAEPAGGARTDAAAPAAVSPAGCVASIDDAHIAASVANAVKVNARITCRRAVQALALRVNLYKKHFFGLLNSLQASTTTSNAGRASLQNQRTFRHCTNRKSTKWFGTAQAASLEGGVVYRAAVVSPHVVSLNCGT